VATIVFEVVRVLQDASNRSSIRTRVRRLVYAINVAITDQWRGEFRVDLLHATVASSGFVTAAAVCDSEFFWIYKSINVATTKQSMARINQSWSRAVAT